MQAVEAKECVVLDELLGIQKPLWPMRNFPKILIFSDVQYADLLLQDICEGQCTLQAHSRRDPSSLLVPNLTLLMRNQQQPVKISSNTSLPITRTAGRCWTSFSSVFVASEWGSLFVWSRWMVNIKSLTFLDLWDWCRKIKALSIVLCSFLKLTSPLCLEFYRLVYREVIKHGRAQHEVTRSYIHIGECYEMVPWDSEPASHLKLGSLALLLLLELLP